MFLMVDNFHKRNLKRFFCNESFDRMVRSSLDHMNGMKNLVAFDGVLLP